MTNLRNRAARKLENQRKELAEAEDRELLRLRGELITANLYAMQKGMRELVCQNYYDPDCAEVKIPLDPLLTPQQNAAGYYKRYNKAKTAEKMLTEQIAKGETDLDYLDSVLTCIHCAEEERDLIEIRQELEDNGYLRAKEGGQEGHEADKVQADGVPLHRRTAHLCGAQQCAERSADHKNGRPERHLVSYKGDPRLPCHPLDRRGRAGPPEPHRGRPAGRLVFSGQGGQKRAGGLYPGAVCKKPAGAKPGKVIYTSYSTAYVTPERSWRKKLRVRK